MPDPLSYAPEEIVGRLIPADRLQQYFDLLMSENSRVNLVSRETTQAGLIRMAAESILPVDILKRRFEGYIDVGSGGGFPAIPLILTGQIKPPITLFERTVKKAKALARIIEGLGLSAEVKGITFEEAKLTPSYQLCTLRYIKLTPTLLGSLTSILAPGGHFVYYSAPEFHVKRQRHVIHRIGSSQEQVIKSLTVFTN
jgi:16S rRNA (guanine527-N7)-methyltransferase